MRKNALDRKALGKSISQRREALGCTQEQLAEKAHCSRSYLSRVERGVTGMSVLMLFRLCSALECLPSELMQDVD